MALASVERNFIQQYLKEKSGAISYQFKKALYDYVKPNSHPQLLFLFNLICAIAVFGFFMDGLTPKIELV
jgi:hypothetical protein